MGKWGKLLATARGSTANIRFADLCSLLERLGFEQRRQTGSHRIYRHATRKEIPFVNLQEDRGGKAKNYQVRQVLACVDMYQLEVTE